MERVAVSTSNLVKNSSLANATRKAELRCALLLFCVDPTLPTGEPNPCTFEDQKICGYGQDKTDIFDWTWNTGGTATVATGPANDHTLGTSRGMFAQYHTLLQY